MTISVYFYGKGHNVFLFNWMDSIQGNGYVLNNVLLGYIIAAYCVVVMGLLFYFKDTFGDLFEYKGHNKRIKRFNAIAITLTVLVIILFILYGVFVFLCYFIKNTKPFVFENIVIANKYLSILIFLFADLFICKSQMIQKKENEKLFFTINDESLKAELEKRDTHKYSTYWIFKEVYVLYYIPTLLLTSFAAFFSEYLLTLFRFTGVIELNHAQEIPDSLSNAEFNLFLNGFETGTIVAGIFVSQLIYLFLVMRLDRSAVLG